MWTALQLDGTEQLCQLTQTSHVQRKTRESPLLGQSPGLAQAAACPRVALLLFPARVRPNSLQVVFQAGRRLFHERC